MTANLSSRLRHKKTAVLACLCFFIGSSLFLPQFAEHATTGVWLFMCGSLLMLVDTLNSTETA